MFLFESQLQHFWMHFHSYEAVIYYVTILHKWQNTNARTKTQVGVFLFVSCVHLREHRPEKLFKPQQGEIRWFGLASPLTTEKVTPTEIFFGARRFDPPFIDQQKTKTFFQCRGFQSLRNSPDEGRPVLFQAVKRCSSARQRRSRGLLVDRSNAINPGTYTVSHVPRTSINGYC